MSDIAIRVQGLAKQYRLGRTVESYATLREQILPWLSPANWFRRGSRAESSDFWALKDISFEVKRGEVVGLIGRNGAGKSTLLKILSRITEPTRGEADLYGRVGSLLEVGTGFHPELTGRENIYLNGAILGMKRAEIARRFDEIVAFAEVEKFIDTAVKHYSSGMYMRLAFSVAAHLEPEILIIDEVLAVGDAAFQDKCLGKMGEVARHGRTVLFVSHNMAVVGRLCSRAILLDSGNIEADGKPVEITSRYLNVEATRCEFTPPPPAPDQAPAAIELLGLTVTTADGRPCSKFAIDEPITLRMTYNVARTYPGLRVGLRVHSGDGGVILTTTNTDQPNACASFQPGRYASTCCIPANFLNYGVYTVSVASDVPNREIVFYHGFAVSFTLEPGLEKSSGLADGRLGPILPLLDWTTDRN